VDTFLRLVVSNALGAALLALLVAGFTRWCRRPAVRHGLWLLVLLKLLVPPFVSISVPGPIRAPKTASLCTRPANGSNRWNSFWNTS